MRVRSWLEITREVEKNRSSSLGCFSGAPCAAPRAFRPKAWLQVPFTALCSFSQASFGTTGDRFTRSNLGLANTCPTPPIQRLSSTEFTVQSLRQYRVSRAGLERHQCRLAPVERTQRIGQMRDCESRATTRRGHVPSSVASPTVQTSHLACRPNDQPQQCCPRRCIPKSPECLLRHADAA